MWSNIEKKSGFTNLRQKHWNNVSNQRKNRKVRFYQKLLHHYYKFLIPENQKILELGSGHGDLLATLNPSHGKGVDISPNMVKEARQRHTELDFICADVHELNLNQTFDVIILSDLLNDIWDAQWILKVISTHSNENTRIIINTHNRVWTPVIRVAERIGLATPNLQQNWLAKNDILNLLHIEGFDVIKSTSEVLIPINIPVIAPVLNKYVAKLPIIRHFNLFHLIICRKAEIKNPIGNNPGVSIIVAARNEEGHIEELFNRIPQMGSKTEVIFVEGGSSDKTYEKIENQIKKSNKANFRLLKQPGKGKGDAVRTGFNAATQDILMILDADMTVAPEDLPRFYEAIVSGKGEFINGVRLVYPMEKKAMRFFNIIGNKFFSLIFTWILGQPIKDTLCGTKVLTKANYQKIADNRSYFGDFDPFGDFDLIFGAAKQNLKIVDMPIRYGERHYGDTNIDRWKAGVLLLRMSVFAAKRLKFI